MLLNLYPLTQGVSGADSLAISYTQDSQVTSATANATQTANISYSQADQVTSITANGKAVSTIGYTQGEQVTSVTVNGKLTGSISYTQADQATSVSANFGASSFNAAINYTQDAQITSAVLDGKAITAIGYTQAEQVTSIAISAASSVNNLIISYTQGNQITAISASIEVVVDTKDGGDDVPRQVKTLKYKPRLPKDDFGNEIQPVVAKVKPNYNIDDTRELLKRLEALEDEDEDDLLMLM